MAKFFNLFVLLVCAALACSLTHAQVSESDFTSVAMGDIDNPNDVFRVELPSVCGQNRQEVPSVLYTIQPGETLQVMTYPSDAVTVSQVDGGKTLGMFWNMTAVADADEAGIIVEFPDNQLVQIDVFGARSQVKAGFTAISVMNVGTSSNVSADLSTVETPIILDVSTSATATVQVPSGDDAVMVNAFVGTSAELYLVGNLTRLDASTSSVTQLQGVVNNPSTSSVCTSAVLRTESCDGIQTSTSGTCLVVADLDIIVDTNQPLTAQGRQSCTSQSSINSGGWGLFVTAVLVALSTLLSTIMTIM
jgi:hypothetical protein